MKSFHLCASLAILFVAATCKAEDILLQVQSVVEERTTADGKPIIVESTEVMVTPGSSFRTRIKNGDHWTVVKGKLSKPVDGKYKVEYEKLEAIDQEYSGGKIVPTITTTRTRFEDIEVEKPATIGTVWTEARWTGSRGRAHNTSTYNAKVRAELILKPVKVDYEDYPTVLIENRPAERSIGCTWFFENTIPMLGFQTETLPESVKVYPPTVDEELRIGGQALIPTRR
jgi:hypothetical protein